MRGLRSAHRHRALASRRVIECWLSMWSHQSGLHVCMSALKAFCEIVSVSRMHLMPPSWRNGNCGSVGKLCWKCAACWLNHLPPVSVSVADMPSLALSLNLSCNTYLSQVKFCCIECINPFINESFNTTENLYSILQWETEIENTVLQFVGGLRKTAWNTFLCPMNNEWF